LTVQTFGLWDGLVLVQVSAWKLPGPVSEPRHAGTLKPGPIAGKFFLLADVTYQQALAYNYSERLAGMFSFNASEAQG